jgi:hypothetical protein
MDSVQTLLNQPPRASSQPYPEHEFTGHGQFHSLKNQPRFKMKALPKSKVALSSPRPTASLPSH